MIHRTPRLYQFQSFVVIIMLEQLQEKVKCPKPKIVYKTSYRKLSQEAFLEEVQHWVGQTSTMKTKQIKHQNYFSIRKDKYAAVRKLTARATSAQLFDEELNGFTSQRSEGKETAQKSVCVTDRQKYCKLRNNVTKLYQKKNKQTYAVQLNRTKSNVGKALRYIK